jgi:UDP-N-acetylglucosamine acyltransferase
MSIHPTALIDRAAQVDPTVEVGPYAVIGADVVIGAHTQIGAHAVIHRYTTVGERCRVHAHACLGDLPQDMAFKESPTYVRIGHDVVLREGVTVHRGTKEGTTTDVGDHCYLMANSHVGHNSILGHHVILANGVLLGGYVEVGDRAFISGNCAIHQFVRVGRLAMVGGVAAMSVDVPPFCVTRTGLLNSLAGLNTIGLRRNGISSEDRLALRAAFHRVFRSGRNRREVVAELRQEQPSPLVLEFLDFIAASKRGVCRPRRGGQTTASDGE